MRRGGLLLALLLAGCGGSTHRGGGTASNAILRTSAAVTSVAGLDAAGSPQVVYDPGDGTLRLRTLAGERRFPVPSTDFAITGLASDFVLTATGSGTTVIDLRTGITRAVDGMAPLGTDGDQVLWQTRDATRALSVQDLNTDVRTPVPIVLGPEDGVIGFRNGRLLLSQGTERPVEGGYTVDYTYRVTTLEGTMVAALAIPEGIDNVRPVALNAAGQVAGTATRPGAILAVDDASYPLRWDASGAPTFLDTTTSAVVVGLEDDGSVVVGPNEENAGRLRLLRGGAPIDLGIDVPHPWQGQVGGKVAFVQSERDESIAAYALP